ncbi:hypothetical protein [Wenxinia marina]|uniref:Muramidase (Phage lambda lysozyme) n=1 Tax=Wenxinia marina DSM 24838 TaxID=1123501 RepID=A0A0D0PH88_9RHOB|nr:hypothetical protein [Wenxinia marina]KIQ70686.1 hypothetical protein Wenmar_01064 [Wenxinia marina DSM 24838]GGL51348.1 hypothetical protein GCM10011392_01890 [Wenxinia marina]
MLRLLAVLTLCAAPAVADGPSLFAGAGGLLPAARGGLFAQARAAGGLFARDASPRFAPSGGGDVARLLDLVASAEAGSAGYDAVQYGARVLPPRRPTDLTVGEILDWIAATPGQPHAIGRYQVIPPTLRGLIGRLGIPRDARFSPALQDALGERLLLDAGLAEFRAGRLSRGAFMDSLARVWAGLPTASGLSHYHGHAGNRAVITRARFEAEMAAIYGGAGA